MSREALVLLVCCCDFRDGAERLMPSKSLGNAVIRAFPGLFRILRMCAPRRAAAVVRPRGREKSADRRRRILISRLLIIRASVPRRKSPFPAYFKGFPAVSPLIPPYPAFLKYPVSPQPRCRCARSHIISLTGNRQSAPAAHQDPSPDKKNRTAAEVDVLLRLFCFVCAPPALLFALQCIIADYIQFSWHFPYICTGCIENLPPFSSLFGLLLVDNE